MSKITENMVYQYLVNLQEGDRQPYWHGLEEFMPELFLTVHSPSDFAFRLRTEGGSAGRETGRRWDERPVFPQV